MLLAFDKLVTFPVEARAQNFLQRFGNFISGKLFWHYSAIKQLSFKRWSHLKQILAANRNRSYYKTFEHNFEIRERCTNIGKLDNIDKHITMNE